MKICIYNGRIIEAQSHSTAGTLLANAEAAGIVGAEEREVTSDEYAALLLAQPKTLAEQNSAIKAQIAALDQKRILAFIDNDTTLLTSLNEQIATLRAQLK